MKNGAKICVAILVTCTANVFGAAQQRFSLPMRQCGSVLYKAVCGGIGGCAALALYNYWQNYRKITSPNKKSQQNENGAPSTNPIVFSKDYDFYVANQGNNNQPDAQCFLNVFDLGGVENDFLCIQKKTVLQNKSYALFSFGMKEGLVKFMNNRGSGINSDILYQLKINGVDWRLTQFARSYLGDVVKGLWEQYEQEQALRSGVGCNKFFEYGLAFLYGAVIANISNDVVRIITA